MHRFTPLNITHEHADIAARLPLIHKDPFDRMLVAQAMVENLIVITRDDQIGSNHSGGLNGDCWRPAWGMSLAEYYLSRCYLNLALVIF